MKKTSLLTVTFLLSLAPAFAGCTKSDASQNSGTPATQGAGQGALQPQKTVAELDPAKLKEQAPASYKAKFETSKGAFTIKVTREWAPLGADRFYNLVKGGFYNEVRFFRVLRKPTPFMAQFGLHGDPAVSKAWTDAKIADDPVKQSNKRGYVTFATSGPNSRTTQAFINFADNANLDGMGFAPFGEVIEGMSVVDSLHADYGEGVGAPNQGIMQARGNEYLKASFPKLDYIKSTSIQ